MKTLALIILLFAAPIYIASCGPSQKPPVVRPPVVIHHEPFQCLDKEPPKPLNIEVIGPEGGCPESFALCMSLESSKNLFRYLSDVQLYADDAWQSCQIKGDKDDDSD